MKVREDERKWDREKKRGWGGEEGRKGEEVEMVEVGGDVNEKWERREVHVIADREEEEKEEKEEEEEDITSFFMKIIISTAYMSRMAWPILFLLVQIIRGDAAFQDMLRVIQNFL